MAILYKTDGSMVLVSPLDPGHGFTLDELHALIECETLDFRSAGHGIVMVCDDVGLLKANPQINAQATQIWWYEYGGDPRYPLAGNILFAARYSEIK